VAVRERSGPKKMKLTGICTITTASEANGSQEQESRVAPFCSA